MNGLFVSFEGPEGSGKTSHAARVRASLRERGFEVVEAREPGGTPVGEAIRDVLQHDAAGHDIVPETEVLLFAASRAQLVHRVIQPALARGAVVISDRFIDSTIAYQAYGRGFDPEWVWRINHWATGGTLPALTLLLDVTVEVGRERLRRRNRAAGLNEDRFEREDRGFHERVREGFLNVARQWPHRVHTLCSEAPFDDVQRAVWARIEPCLPARPARGEGAAS